MAKDYSKNVPNLGEKLFSFYPQINTFVFNAFKLNFWIRRHQLQIRFIDT